MPYVANAQVIVYGTNVVGNKAEYVCYNGFKILGEVTDRMNITCLTDGNLDGYWTTPPECEG